MTTNIARVIEVTGRGATVAAAERAAVKAARREYGRAIMKPWTRSIRPIGLGVSYVVTVAYVVPV